MTLPIPTVYYLGVQRCDRHSTGAACRRPHLVIYHSSAESSQSLNTAMARLRRARTMRYMVPLAPRSSPLASVACPSCGSLYDVHIFRMCVFPLTHRGRLGALRGRETDTNSRRTSSQRLTWAHAIAAFIFSMHCRCINQSNHMHTFALSRDRHAPHRQCLQRLSSKATSKFERAISVSFSRQGPRKSHPIVRKK